MGSGGQSALKIQVPNIVVWATGLLTVCLLGIVFVAGVLLSDKEELTDLVVELEEAVEMTVAKMPGRTNWWYRKTKKTKLVPTHRPNATQPGLTLINGIGAKNQLMMRVIDADGSTVQDWEIDWYKMWPNPTHLHKSLLPKRKPAALIHGIKLMPNNDVVFNFEHLGALRVNACSEVVWRLPYITHHSIFQDDNGDLWITANRYHTKKMRDYPHLKVPRLEPTVIRISPEGELLEEFSVLDMIADADLRGYLFQGTKDNFGNAQKRREDLIHLNDVEVFSSDMTPGFFQPGDIMLSLRNLNSIAVLDGSTRQIKYWRMGGWVWQHDPDFIDGNRISVYDNNNSFGTSIEGHSRIVVVDARTDKTEIRYPRKGSRKFFSGAMGKHQILENGNLLITETMNGRAFEITAEDKVVWEYLNIVEPGKKKAILQEATRLPTSVTAESFQASRMACS
jgi:hypothetical protein